MICIASVGFLFYLFSPKTQKAALHKNKISEHKKDCDCKNKQYTLLILNNDVVVQIFD